MADLAVALPIRTGKVDALKAFQAEKNGPRAAETEALSKRFGVRREVVWIQRTPNGDLGVLFWEADAPENVWDMLAEVRASDDDFATWAREQGADIFMMDPSQPQPPMPEQVSDRRYGG